MLRLFTSYVELKSIFKKIYLHKTYKILFDNISQIKYLRT